MEAQGTPARGRAAGGTRAAPALGIGHLPGDGPRLGRDVSPWVGVRISLGEGKRGQTQPGMVGLSSGHIIPMTTGPGFALSCAGVELLRVWCFVPRAGGVLRDLVGREAKALWNEFVRAGECRQAVSTQPLPQVSIRHNKATHFTETTPSLK